MRGEMEIGHIASLTTESGRSQRWFAVPAKGIYGTGRDGRKGRKGRDLSIARIGVSSFAADGY